MFKFLLLCLAIWVVWHYRKVWVRVVRLVLEPLKKDGPHRPLWWRMKMRLNHVRLQLDGHHSTWAFIILSARLFVCNTVGHRWTKWEQIKFGNFGDSRSCKVCLINHSKDEKGRIRYTETHDKRVGWQEVNSPDAVFNRAYIKRPDHDQPSTNQ